MGRCLGSLAYYLYPHFRKRTLSNIALALRLPEKELKRIARQSMQNLMITLLEYPKLAWEKEIHRLAYCKNPEVAEALLKQGQGIIFFCGHQANWEVLFIEGTKRMPGMAIGRPIRNRALYDWIVKLREKNGGTIVSPKEAIRKSLQSLKKSCFVGVVGDQGMPDAGYSSLFFGLRAWTSPIAAILAYRTGSPILVAITKREKGRYCITYSDPIWPNRQASQEQEIPRLMEASLSLLEESIREKPEEWLWQHNRWKQQTIERLKKEYRQDTILVILPEDHRICSYIQTHLALFREIYPLEFITLMLPDSFSSQIDLPNAEQKRYKTKKEILIRDYRFKLVFNLTQDSSFNRHFLNLAAIKVVHLPHFTPDQLKKTVCRNAS